ncbi:TPA: hypothetical protein ACSRWF_003541 [Morganella morganii]
MKIISAFIYMFLSCLVGALCLYGLIIHFGVDKMSIPSPVLTVLILPLAYCCQAIYKLSDLKESKQLSNSELNRLSYIVDIKRRRLFSCIVFYMASGLFIAISMMISDGGVVFKTITLIVSGGLLGIAVYTVFVIYSLMNEVTNFKAKLIQEEENIRHRKMD